MPFQQEILWHHVRISFWRITEREDEMLRFLSHVPAYADDVALFKSESRRKEWLATRCLLHHQMGEEVRLAYLATGRPVLKVPTGQRSEISISHTAEWAAIAIAPQGERVGLDMERLSHRAFLVRHRFLQTEELALLTDETSAALLWSAKEAIYKLCDHEGLRFLGDMLLRKEGEGDQLIADLPTLQREAVVHTMIYEDCAVSIAQFR